MSDSRDSELFQALILQLGQAGWMALGKIANPVTGKVERHLELARLTIDTVAGLETRTRGNLDPDEKTLLERTLRELRLNYVDEVKKGDAPVAPPTSGDKQ
jgi:hypothetical protein